MAKEGFSRLGLLRLSSWILLQDVCQSFKSVFTSPAFGMLREERGKGRTLHPAHWPLPQLRWSIRTSAIPKGFCIARHPEAKRLRAESKGMHNPRALNPKDLNKMPPPRAELPRCAVDTAAAAEGDFVAIVGD